MLTDGHGTALVVSLTGGNCNDVPQLMPLLEAVPPAQGRVLGPTLQDVRRDRREQGESAQPSRSSLSDSHCSQH
ncbi:hypothetical protein [Actinomadura coerulea]|uniref:hypothetical protein n=1 Tax=Actinomadura coerulea TaxID=46159 RepID=UPI0034194A5E